VGILAALVVAVLVAPLGEELLYRGVLQRGLTARWGVRWALPVASVAFLLGHGPDMGAFHLVAGLVYGWVAHRTASVWPAVVLHAVNNAAVLALLAVFPAV
jgi:membrane protease YdiL (CAAX protease family)